MSKETPASGKADGQGRQKGLLGTARTTGVSPCTSLRKGVALMEQFLLDVLTKALAGVLVVLVAPYLKKRAGNELAR
jgi:hypothetical protein